MRYINIANEKSRDAQVVYKSISSPSKVHMVMDSGESVQNRRLLKGTSKNTIKALLKQYKDLGKVTEAIILDDPDVDIELEGKTLSNTARVYINKEEKVVYKIMKNEQVFLPNGTLKEEREPRYLDANILSENPLKWTNKMVPRKKIYNKLVFNKNYQLSHVNGLTYDFLFAIAKDLADKDSMVMLAAGAKGNKPLVFNDGGKPYRAFLEGRVKDDRYCLILHLTDLELKPLPNKNK